MTALVQIPVVIDPSDAAFTAYQAAAAAFSARERQLHAARSSALLFEPASTRDRHAATLRLARAYDTLADACTDLARHARAIRAGLHHPRS